MSTHAFLSPSGAPYWTRCLAKPYMEAGCADSTSAAAAEGTSAHELRARCLIQNTDACDYLGQVIEGFEVTQEMADAVQQSLDVIRAIGAGEGCDIHVEVPLDISVITGEKDAKGTSDTVILRHATHNLWVDDYKHGRGVKVFAQDNEQLLVYAGAALFEFDLVGDWQTITLSISQPRLGHFDEWTISVEELQERLATVSSIAAQILAGSKDTLTLAPGEKQCKFCRAKATCPALNATVFSEFEAIKAEERTPIEMLSHAMSQVDLIEGWCKAVRAETERRLLAGTDVVGWKLVQGKRGNRAWTDKAQAEAVLKAMRIPHDQMYDYAVISPTSAEKLSKLEVIGPRQWPKLQALVSQSEGKPSVAPESDDRPALVADSFQNLLTGEE